MTLLIIAFTVIISIVSFNNPDTFSKLLLNPYTVVSRKEYYRVLSHGFIHADWIHLFVNMFVLYSFGTNIERYFDELTSEGLMHFPKLWFLLLYLGGIIISSLTTIYKHKENSYYNCVGASGAVSAVLFCSIFFAPLSQLQVFLMIPLPAIVFGILYLIYSQYMSKKNYDNINHDAHFIGAVFGFVFPIIMDYKWFMDIFIYQLLR